MRVNSTLGLRLQHSIVRLTTRGVVVHRHGATAIGDVNAMCAIRFHQQRLSSQCVGRQHVAHHQKARYVHAQAARRLDVLLRDIGLRAMRRDAHRPHPHFVGALQVADRADAREKQRGQNRMFEHFCDRSDPVPVGVCTKSIVERGTLKAITVCDLDGVHLRSVEGSGNGLDLLEAILMADGVHAVTQCHVLDVELLHSRIEVHAIAS